MRQPDVDKLMAMVEERTGYPVTTSVDSTMMTHSRMITASETTPVHLILLNPKYDLLGNFLVANQCAMILLKWADPKRIPDFAVPADQWPAIAKMLAPDWTMDDFKMQHFIQPLVLQLVSLPLQIMAAVWLHKEFPALRDEQRNYMMLDLREASACLAPSVKEASPKPVYDKSVAMGCAYALWWAEAEGSQIAVLPYKAMGYLAQGQELLAALKAVPEADKARWQKVVDAWATILGMRDFYTWTIRNL